ncbi:TetR/AcrR family transcriptional regulator [Aquipuribacter nitratireducens]|uniref:TetR/AcrR family transcriptional regulator n=1 Tax=Aquipuribacter nitratireducens TaxID=650104 RepID=A0ABW0GL09_9MICO
MPRRDRLRAATEAEIVTTARELLVEGGPAAVTVREVGRRMGMTASALYRYVDGLDGLVDRLAASFFDELTEALQDRLTGSGTADDAGVGEALLTASRAFRDWCVAHPAEFALMYGSGVHQLESGCPRTEAAGGRFGQVFLGLLVDGLGRGAAAPPTTAPAGPDVFDVLPGPLGERFARAWVRLLGVVMVEVIGRLGHTGADPEVVFEAEMADCARDIVQVLQDQREGAPDRA